MRILIYIILFSIANISYSQFNLSFYQMGAATPQHNNYNASAFPKPSFFKLPWYLRFDLSVNNSFSLSDVFTETGDST